MQYAAAYNTCSVVYNKSLNDLKAVNGYQKRPNETMQLIMWIEFLSRLEQNRDIWASRRQRSEFRDRVSQTGTVPEKPGRLVSLN